MKQKRGIWSMVALVFCIAFLLAGCQPTPDTPPVVNKSEGLSKEAILPAVSQGVKEIDAPSHWKQSLERMQGHMAVEADVDIVLPEISNTPVIELAQMDFTEQRLRELVDYFTGGAPLFKVPAPTRAELEQQLALCQSVQGVYARYNDKEREKSAQRLETMLETAQDKPYEEPVSIAFRQAEPKLRSYILKGDEDVPQGNLVFSAVTQTGGQAATLRAEKFDADAGTNSNFSYVRGTVQSEADLAKQEEYIEETETFTTWDFLTNDEREVDRAEAANMRAAIDQAWQNGCALGQEEAVAQGAKVLQDLSVQTLSLESATKGALRYGQQGALGNLQENEGGTLKPGYSLVYTLDLGGLRAFQQEGGYIYPSLPETTYGPRYTQEQLQLFVSEDGIEQVEWYYMTTPVATIAENTKLLPFEQVAQRLADHLSYTELETIKVNQMAVDDMMDVRYTILGVTLRASYLNAFEAPQNVWLAPVWVFDIKNSWKVEEGGEEYSNRMTVMINAVDGGYVSFTDSTELGGWQTYVMQYD